MLRNWIRLGFGRALLGIETQRVIGLRLLTLAGGGLRRSATSAAAEAAMTIARGGSARNVVRLLVECSGEQMTPLTMIHARPPPLWPRIVYALGQVMYCYRQQSTSNRGGEARAGEPGSRRRGGLCLGRVPRDLCIMFRLRLDDTTRNFIRVCRLSYTILRGPWEA
jgi:hypothetical protein